MSFSVLSINRWAKNLEGKFAGPPLVEARIHYKLGMAYYKIRDHRAAIPHMARAIEINREQPGGRASPVVVNYLAICCSGAGRYSEAERLFDELIEAERLNPGDVDLLSWYKCNLACVYVEQGRYEEAKQLLLDTMGSGTEWWKRWSPEGKPYLGHLAEAYLYQGLYGKAERQFCQFLDDRGDVALGHPTLPSLGYVYMAQSRYDEAQDLFTKGIEFCNRELPGKNHPTTLAYMNGLAVLRTKQNQYAAAEGLFRETLEAREAKLGEDHPSTLTTKNDLAVLYKVQARYDEAQSLLIEAVEGRLLKLGDKHAYTQESLNHLIELYEAWGEPEKAEKWRASLTRRDDVVKRD